MARSDPRVEAQVARFEGEPGNLQTVVAVPAADRRSVAVVAQLPKGVAGQIRTLTAPVGESTTKVRLLLPAQTPAGSYHGELSWSGGTMPAVVVVRKHSKITAIPHDLVISAAAGEVAEAGVVLHNAGNAAVELHKTYAVPLEHADALDRAIIAGLVTDRGSVERFGVAADSLADSQVGVARLVLREGATTLPPGESHTIQVELRLPDQLAPGTAYAGTWSVDGVDVPVEVVTPARVDPPPGKASAPRRKSTKEKA
ncbi:MAG: hypothetical protein ABI912_02340 [Actinomycetota bacterium]